MRMTEFPSGTREGRETPRRIAYWRNKLVSLNHLENHRVCAPNGGSEQAERLRNEYKPASRTINPPPHPKPIQMANRAHPPQTLRPKQGMIRKAGIQKNVFLLLSWTPSVFLLLQMAKVLLTFKSLMTCT